MSSDSHEQRIDALEQHINSSKWPSVFKSIVAIGFFACIYGTCNEVQTTNRVQIIASKEFQLQDLKYTKGPKEDESALQDRIHILENNIDLLHKENFDLMQRDRNR